LPKLILFVTSTRIGDAVLSMGLLAHLIETDPDAIITVACGELPAPLFEAVPQVERVIPMRKQRGRLHWFGLWRACIARRWDLVVDLRSSGIAYLLAARQRRVLRSSRAPVHRVRSLADVIGLQEPPAPRIWTTESARARATELVPGAGPVLAVGPTANWPRKEWPAPYFAALIDRLTNPAGILPGARIALFGAPTERAAAAPVIDSVPAERRLDLIGKLDLVSVAACLQRCVLYIGNDSGLMHLAAAAGVPTLGLFGPSPAVHYAPWGPYTAVAQTDTPYEELVGGPDFDDSAGDSLMTSLSVESVEAAAAALWQRAQGRAA
jgi:ADP-heptose:LPS heptosyltransferase